jgi:XRE family transcriptional regulator, regulator of sulfur utilization
MLGGDHRYSVISFAMSEEAPDIGAGIRRRRQAQGLTLDALARASGVSAAMLSEVERAVKNPTVKLAYEIARALGCTLTELLDEPEPSRAHVVRATERRELEDPETGVVRRGLRHPLMRPGTELVWYEIPPGAAAGEMAPNLPGVVETLTVLRGELCLRLGEETLRLQRGDSVGYGAQVTMDYRNEGRQLCEILLVCER